VRFLHVADVHLDSPLTGLARRASIPPEVLDGCTRRAFANAIDLAIAEEVDFVVIAGDLYDGDQKDFSTALCFAREMKRLGRPCLMVRGNHDAASVITRTLELPPNVRAFGARHPETIRLDDLGVAIHGQSFPNRAVPEDLSLDYPAPVPGMFNIGLLHTSAENPGAHETYAPCRLETLVVRGYQYWALGHIHERRELHRDPPVVFAGNTQGRHVNETGAKGVTLVHVEAGRVVRVEHRPTDVLRWAAPTVDLDGAATMADVAARLRFALAAASDGADGRPVIARVTLIGRTACHASLVADPETIEAECQAAALAASDRLHIEGVRVRTAPPHAQAMGAETALAALDSAFRAALDDPAVQAGLLKEFAAIAGLPGGAGAVAPRTADELRARAPEAWATIAHALSDAAP
jgi:predicted phosphodiesterase